MSSTKRYLEKRSEELGYAGELTGKIMDEITDQDAARVDALLDAIKDSHDVPV
jgi:hypothetical protein